MAASTGSSDSLKALIVFRNDINKELVRTIHVYQSLGEAEPVVVEREYFFHKEHDYNETKDVSRILTRQGFDVKKYHVGLLDGVWQCILVFDRDAIADIEDIPDLLITFRNSKLAAIPNLANDLDIVFSHKYERGNSSPVSRILEVPNDFVPRSPRTPRVPMLDLNHPPPYELENEEINPTAAG